MWSSKVFVLNLDYLGSPTKWDMKFFDKPLYRTVVKNMLKKKNPYQSEAATSVEIENRISEGFDLKMNKEELVNRIFEHPRETKLMRGPYKHRPGNEIL